MTTTTVRRIKTVRQNYDLSTYVGRPDEIFYGPDGILRYGDGVTVGGVPFGSVREENFGQNLGQNSGVFNFSVGETSSIEEPLVTVSNVRSIKFDKDTGFNVEDLGNGEVKVSLGSTFKTWKVDGEIDLVAVGEDQIKFEAGPGIKITTDPAGDIKTIKFEVVGGSSGTVVDVEDIPVATETSKGVVKIGNNIQVAGNGLITVKSSKVIQEAIKAPVSVNNPRDDEALVYKNNEWINAPIMYWASRNW
jgi:hypothetical protein